MITKLKLGNFRVFCEPVTVRFRPITVLIGRNNAGKSSIIKFLLMLQQSLYMDSPDFLNPEGERVKLGDFGSLKNSQSKKDSLMFELELETGKAPRGAEFVIDGVKRVIAGKKEETLRTPPPDESSLEQESKAHFIIAADVPYPRTKTGTHALTAKSNSGFVLSLERKIRRHSSALMGFTKLAEKVAVEHPGKIADDWLKKMFAGGSELDSKQQLMHLQSMEEMYTEMYIGGARTDIADMRHIKPARQAFSRVLEMAHPVEGSVGQDGKFALPHLKEMMKKPSAQRAQLVSAYLESVGNIKKILFKKSDGVAADVHAMVMAVNSKTGASSHLMDFGFGVSQALPVIVQGAIAPKGAQFMVEQPEDQLHPTAQLELGSFFADIWKKFGVGSIIETHSDNILLRLRRLIANGTLDKDDVSVAYFEIKKGKATVENLAIESDGSMRPGLPMEFFHASIREALNLRAKQ